jgi:hypothetical protein
MAVFFEVRTSMGISSEKCKAVRTMSKKDGAEKALDAILNDPSLREELEGSIKEGNRPDTDKTKAIRDALSKMREGSKRKLN